jgi:hypothetical protein
MGKLAARDVGVEFLSLAHDHQRVAVELPLGNPLTDARSRYADLAREFSFAGEVRQFADGLRQSRESLAVRNGIATITRNVEFE